MAGGPAMSRHANPRGPRQLTASARADAAAADKLVEQASQARFAELMRLDPQARLAHITDVDLLTADRVKLRRSVQAQLRNSWLRWPKLLSAKSLAPLLGRPSATALACAGLCVALGTTGWLATAHAYINPVTQDMDFRPPEGGFLRRQIPAGTKFGIRQREGVIEARLWLHGRGYAKTQLVFR